MTRRSSWKRTDAVAAIAALLTLAFCLGAIASERPDGWGALSHSNEAEPGYDVVFAQDSVLRIDFEIAPDDWQAMLDDLRTNFFGNREGNAERPVNEGVAPPEQTTDLRQTPPHIAACVGKSEGDAAVLVDPSGREIEGTCGYDPKGKLIFMPNDVQQSQSPLDEGNRRQEDVTTRALNFPTTSETNPLYVETTCRFNGQVWEHVGIRFKGNSSLRAGAQSKVLKIPFHLEFDHFEDDYPEIDDQRFYGFKDLSLSNGFHDNSLIREKTTNDLFRLAGVPCAVSAFYRVYIDYGEGPQYFGLYTMTEIPDDPMLDLMFGNSGGNLYKPEGGAATFSYFEEAAFTKKTNVDEGDWSDVAAVYEAVNAPSDDPAIWRQNLEKVLNVQAFLRWLAADTVIGNWDTYGRMPHNFYVYTDEDDGLLNWIPWDNNESLNASLSRARDLSLQDVGEEWPLIRRLADDPIYFATYLQYMREIIDSVWDVPALQARVQASWELISPYVIGDEGEQEDFTLLRSASDFITGIDVLVDYIGSRHGDVETFLSEMEQERRHIAITEIYYNPSSDQGEDDVYEFLELANLGDQTVSLSGWRFVDGIEFEFPSEVQLEPEECLILAIRGSTYANVGCQVLEWSAGKLANDGERLELVDANGQTMDVVIYDDDAPWDESTDGGGRSLEAIVAGLPNDLALNWRASSNIGGSPGWIDR